MNAPRDEYLDLCAGFVLDALEPEDRARLEERLRAGDLLCEAALHEMYAGVLLLAATAPPARPRPQLRPRVMAAIDAAGAPEPAAHAATSAEGHAAARVVGHAGARAVSARASDVRRDPIAEARARRSRGVSRGAVWGLLAAVAAVIVALVGWSTAQSLRNELALTEARVARLEGELASAEEQLAEEIQWADVVGARNVVVVSIDPQSEEVAQVFGRCYMDPGSGRAVVYFYDVPQLPENSHQLWAIDDAGLHPVGFVHPDGAGNDEVRLTLDEMSGVKALAVSLEPKGGSPDPDGPSGPVMLMGRVGE